MKLLDLLNENELEKTTNEGPIDEIGKFFVVKKPAKGMTKENMVYEATVFDEVKMDETKGVYKNKSEANRHATEALKEYDMMMKEVEDAMNEFRTSKKDIDEKKNKAKELIKKLK
jgi:hypothetical protein